MARPAMAFSLCLNLHVSKSQDNTEVQQSGSASASRSENWLNPFYSVWQDFPKRKMHSSFKSCLPLMNSVPWEHAHACTETQVQACSSPCARSIGGLQTAMELIQINTDAQMLSMSAL